MRERRLDRGGSEGEGVAEKEEALRREEELEVRTEAAPSRGRLDGGGGGGGLEGRITSELTDPRDGSEDELVRVCTTCGRRVETEASFKG